MTLAKWYLDDAAFARHEARTEDVERVLDMPREGKQGARDTLTGLAEDDLYVEVSFDAAGQPLVRLGRCDAFLAPHSLAGPDCDTERP